MTEEFRSEMSEASKFAFNESYKKSYENSKALLRPYKLLILEAIKTYNFFTEEYDTKTLLEKKELVGTPSEIKIYNDTYAEFNNHYGIIYLNYDLRFIHRERIEPEFIANRTFKGNVMKLFLEEEGIKVDFHEHSDEDYGTNERVTITFDNTILLDLIKNTEEEIKKREKTQKRNNR
jgi:hypothetical protein